MTYREFRAWVEKHTRDGGWGFHMARLCVYTIAVMDAVPKRKRERVWRQFQNIINVRQLVEYPENPPKVTQYDRLRNLSVEGLATVLDNYDEIFEKPCDARFCKNWRADGMCGGCSQDECHQATVNWLKSEVEAYNPPTANAAPVHFVKEGKGAVEVTGDGKI